MGPTKNPTTAPITRAAIAASCMVLAELCNINEYSHVLDVGCREKVEYSSYSLGC